METFEDWNTRFDAERALAKAAKILPSMSSIMRSGGSGSFVLATLAAISSCFLASSTAAIQRRRRRQIDRRADGAPPGHFEIVVYVSLDTDQTTTTMTTTTLLRSSPAAIAAYVVSPTTIAILVHHPKQESVARLIQCVEDALLELNLGGSATEPPCLHHLFPIFRTDSHPPSVSTAMIEEGMLEACESYLRKRSGNDLHIIELAAAADDDNKIRPPPPLRPFPVAGIAIPVLGHAYLSLMGSYSIPQYNIAANLFPPSGKYAYGATARLQKGSPGINDFGDDDNSRLTELVDDLRAGDSKARQRADHSDVIAAGFPPKTLFHPDAEEFVTLTANAEVVRELLARREDFPKLWNRPNQLNIQRFTENGLFTSSENSEDWKTAHALLPRAFNELRIRQYASTIIRKTGVFIEQWTAQLVRALHGIEEGGDGTGNASFYIDDVPEFLTAMTADAIVECSMGVDLKNVERIGAGEPAHDFVRLFRFCLGHSTGLLNPASEYGIKSKIPFSGYDADRLECAFRAAKRELEGMVEDMVENARASTDDAAKHSVIASMFNDRASATGKRVRLRGIFGHVMNLMIAGHETTAATLGFTMQLIAEHPIVEARCLEEARRVLNGKTTLDAKDIPKLTYIEQTFREALRLYSPVVELTRDAAHDTILAGHRVFQGERISVLTRALHTNPEYWGGEFGDPLSFNPDRFHPDAVAARHPNAYHPWGFGSRACIGSQFALFEAKSFLAIMLVHFKWIGKPGYHLMPGYVKGSAAPSAKDLAFEVKARPGGPLDTPHLAASTPSFSEPAAVRNAASPPPSSLQESKTTTPTSGEARRKATVLFGSNAGASEQMANEIARFVAARGEFSVNVATLDEAATTNIAATDVLLVAASTYNGMPPDNAKAFLPSLSVSENIKKGSLEGVSFAVFGLGNSQWRTTYMQYPREVDLALQEAGATRLVDMGAADMDGTTFEDSFEAWLSSLGTALGASSTEGAAAALEAESARLEEEASKLQVVDEVPKGCILFETAADALAGANEIVDKLLAKGVDASEEVMKELAKDRIHPLRVHQAPRELCTPGCGRSVSHVTLQLTTKTDQEPAYRAGDHLEILPCNSSDLVSMALDALGIAPEAPVAWHLGRGTRRQARGAHQVLATKPVLEPLYVKARDVMGFFPDLAAPPSKKCVAKIAEHASGCPKAIAELAALSKDAERFSATMADVSLAELLARYRGRVQLDLGLFVALAKPMAPRFYSISSSPSSPSDDVLTLTVARVSYVTKTGRVHRGLASSLLGDAQPGEGNILGAVRRMTSGFCVPEDASAPLLLVGPGTGLAPMMAFLHERRARRASGETLGKAVLFFGCRSDDDYLYKDELAGMLKDGTLTSLHVALSRSSGVQKVYVQDLIAANAKEVWSLMRDPSCRVFVCGDARSMAPSVRRAFIDAAHSAGGMSVSSAESFVGGMTYIEDVWAG